jgi:hypothetical protein
MGWIMTDGSCTDSTTTLTGFVCTSDDASDVPDVVSLQAFGKTNNIMYLDATVAIGAFFFMEGGLAILPCTIKYHPGDHQEHGS